MLALKDLQDRQVAKDCLVTKVLLVRLAPRVPKERPVWLALMAVLA
jgi:hypothetical protein